MKLKKISLILAFAIVLPLLFSGTALAEEEDIPTIFINNDAWYKNSLLPLITKGTEQLVPISVFAAFDHISISYKEIYGCYLIEGDDGSFISISNSGRYLTHLGERGDIAVADGKSELYISAVTAASVLGVGLEHAVFYDKDVLRLYHQEKLQSLEILIDYYITSADSYIGSAGIGGAAIRRETFSFFADISDMSGADIKKLLAAASDNGISMTFAVDSDFVSNKKNHSLMLDISAAGHTFAVSIDASGEKDPATQVSECNRLLYTLLKKKTFLLLTTLRKNELKAKGFILLNDSYRLSGISTATSVNFTINDTIYFDRVNDENTAKFKSIISEAKANGRTVTALNMLAGN